MRRSTVCRVGVLLLTLACVQFAMLQNAAASSGKIIYTFAGGVDGSYPESDLILDAAGNLYGTTSQGGTSNCGTVFELNRTQAGWKHQVLYSFSGSPGDGCGPQAGLVLDSAGNLYGTTSGGGANSVNCSPFGGCGTVFKLAPNSQGGWNETVLYNFGNYNGDGENPQTDLVFDSQGNLYGTTSSGGIDSFKCFYSYFCGTVYKLTPGSGGIWTESVIYQFAGDPDGWDPVSPVVLDASGNLYGATYYGGTAPCIGYRGAIAGCGAIYKLSPNSSGSWTETMLYSFHHGQGTANFPSSGLILAKDGRLLGTSTLGGNGDGAFFALEPATNGWEQNVLYRFYGNPDGATPVGQLARGFGGSLFGATLGGGTNGVNGGTVFELQRADNRWKERVLFNVNAITNGSPNAGPVVDSQGHIYGTLYGSSGNFGAIYEVIP